VLFEGMAGPKLAFESPNHHFYSCFYSWYLGSLTWKHQTAHSNVHLKLMFIVFYHIRAFHVVDSITVKKILENLIPISRGDSFFPTNLHIFQRCDQAEKAVWVTSGIFYRQAAGLRSPAGKSPKLMADGA